jgi:hypothetical protein
MGCTNSTKPSVDIAFLKFSSMAKKSMHNPVSGQTDQQSRDKRTEKQKLN